MNHFSIKFKIIAVAFFVSFSPFTVFAQTSGEACSSEGYTINTINGVFTDENAAISNRDALKYYFKNTYKGEKLIIDFLLNPPHLGGIGDVIKSIEQGLFDQETVTDYDLVEMLKSASEKVRTQKLLLVAHSQGNFYANSFYDTVAEQEAGVSKESMGVYSVATPASSVAGGGKWLTSDTDKVIAGVVGHVPFKSIMPPNTHIKLKSDDDITGHDFAKVYLKYRGGQVVSDIAASLDALKSNDRIDENMPCIVAPKLTRVHKIEGAIFAVADPVASKSISTVVAVAKGAHQAGSTLAQGIFSVANTLASVFNTSPKEQSSAVAEVLDLPLTKEQPVLLSSSDVSDVVSPVKELLALEQKVAMAEKETQALAFALADFSLKNTNLRTEEQTNQNQNSDEAYVGGSPDAVLNTENASANKTVPGVSLPIIVTPGFGGGGDATTQTTSSANAQTATDTIPPSAPAITAPADFLRTFTSPSIIFSGTAESGSVINSDVSSATTTVSQSGEWSLALTFNQGTTTAQFFATDGAGNISAATSTTFFIDSIAPQSPAPAIAECASSLASSGCLVATTTLSISWLSSEANDFSHFVINKNGAVSTTTATSTSASATNNTTYSFAIAAIDTSGNASATTTITAEISTSPVVINEVAWGGTNASTADEWIELYNKTASTVNLSEFIIYTADGSPYISLSGSIPAGGYYLIERKNTGETDEATQSPVKDITADLWTSFGDGLSNDGENLILARKSGSSATTTIDEISYCYVWCAKGSGSPDFRSMERFDVNVAGTDWTNWGRNQVIIRNGYDTNGSVLNGTPKAYNSFSRMLNKGNPTITENMTIEKTKSPYVVNNDTITVQSGKTLTLEPGAIIKFYNNARLAVSGTLNAQGTESDKIIFTSFLDDAYGGDTNQDGSVTAPAKRDWYGVELALGSDASVFDYALFRYGGKYYDGQGQPSANLYLANTSPSINHSTFEYGGMHGLRLFSASSTISNSVFQHNGSGFWMGGVMSTGGAPTIENNQFSDNVIGIYMVASEARVSSNTIASSTSEAIYASGVIGDGYFSGNSGSGNAWNGIALASAITKTNATTTLKQNTLPYLIKQSGTVTILASSTLAIDPDVIVKFKDERLLVNGHLSIQSTAEHPVTFTSVYDDSNGNDASNDGASTGATGIIQSTVLQSGSTSNISGAVFKFMKTALSYLNSPIILSDVIFSDNTLAVSADTATTNNYSISVSNITFGNNNVATTSPANLW
ncbi:MAG: lamin tail domain-containing protein [Parcubacteria group bacterium]|nr:lamin tail domain-containing protein [Parcubacteria group bacterium]